MFYSTQGLDDYTIEEIMAFLVEGGMNEKEASSVTQMDLLIAIMRRVRDLEAEMKERER